MFINTKVLKRLMKEAYKGGGLVAGIVTGGYPSDGHAGLYLSGGAWACWLIEHKIPRAIKGYLVELAGRMPTARQGLERIIDSSDTPVPLLLEEASRNRRLITDMVDFNCDKTQRMGVILSKNMVEILRIPRNRWMTAVSVSLMQLFDLDSIDYEACDMVPIGPQLSGDGTFVYWHCEEATLAIYGMKMNLDPLYKAFFEVEVSDTGVFTTVPYGSQEVVEDGETESPSAEDDPETEG